MKNEGARGALLVADDEEFIRVGLTEVLRRSGFACESVAAGTELLARLRERTFDALISDIHMPGNTELEIIGAAREIAPGLPVILLTGKPTVETAARSVRLPVTAYLTKPPNMDELERILDEAIADYRGFRTLQSGRARLREWEEEIERIERSLRSAPPATSGPMASYLRLTLRQVILMLSDLEQATNALERSGAAATLTQVDHEAALRRTVAVLERTKQNFKSKDLAELRKQLEQLLSRDPAVD